MLWRWLGLCFCILFQQILQIRITGCITLLCIDRAVVLVMYVCQSAMVRILCQLVERVSPDKVFFKLLFSYVLFLMKHLRGDSFFLCIIMTWFTDCSEYKTKTKACWLFCFCKIFIIKRIKKDKPCFKLWSEDFLSVYIKSAFG